MVEEFPPAGFRSMSNIFETQSSVSATIQTRVQPGQIKTQEPSCRSERVARDTCFVVQ